MNIRTVAKEMPAGWYAKTCHAQAESFGPHATKSAAIASVRAAGFNLVVTGVSAHRHDGSGLMLVHERF
jgi:hypothetical protein